jgi:hypothetical protein
MNTYFRNKKFWEELIANFSWYDMGRIENDACNNSSIAACVFIAAVTFFTEPLPSKDRGIRIYRLMRGIYDIRGLNLAMVKPTTVQVTKLPL